MIDEPQMVPFSKIFESSYRIPLYQRSYAWSRDEITRLLQDVYDAYLDKAEEYFIGTLTLSSESDADSWDVIDGQQRLTTLFLILAWMKNHHESYPRNFKANSLKFECRSSSNQALENIFKNDLSVAVDGVESTKQDRTQADSLYSGYTIIDKELQGLFVEPNRQDTAKTANRLTSQGYFDFLLNKVMLVCTKLPEGTNLNRYFEIMNSRGRQLEQHEILKARFMTKLNSSNQDLFSRIWDACSNMNEYVQMHFTDTTDRTEYFGNSWDCLNIETINTSWKIESNPPEGNGYSNLFEILDDEEPDSDNNQAPAKSSTMEIGTDDSGYHSIIDFPNFLMHVLSIYRGANTNDDNDKALTDQKLLDEFEKTFGREVKESEAQNFAETLLQCRFLFDSYVIKVDGQDHNDSNWSLKRLHKNRQSEAHTNNTFNSEINTDILMLQSMYQVTQTGYQHKRFLQSILSWLMRQSSSGKTIDPVDFRDEIRRMARKDLSNILSRHSNMDEALNQGVGTDHFIFNYLDYALWRTLTHEPSNHEPSQKEVFSQSMASDIRAHFGHMQEKTISMGTKWNLDAKKFQFRYRTSVEHFYPQQPGDGHPRLSECLDDIGNLCIMTRSENSRRNNLLPEAKVAQYRTDTQSLKFQFMVGEMAVAGDKWQADQIDNHSKDVKKWLNALAESQDSKSRKQD